MFRNRRYTIYIVCGIGVLAAGFAVWRLNGKVISEFKGLRGGGASADAPPKIFPNTIPEAEQSGLNLPQTFRHSGLKFSFSYPNGFAVTNLASPEGGETIVVQNTKRNAGFQIHLEPYDDPDTEITAARLARDIPEMVVKEPQEVTIGSGGKGLAWIASDTGTREVWFIFGGTLYQLTAPVENDTLLRKVLNTWKFE